MNENLFETQYDITKKTKIKKFYESNKLLIVITIFIIVVAIASLLFYWESKESKKTYFSEKYIEAQVFLENGEKIKAKKILKKIIFESSDTYSALSLFLILNENLIIDREELLTMYDRLIKNNKFDNEIKNLIIFKKALFQSNFVNEQKLIESINPLINSDTVWKPHALLLMGDYFFFKKEYLKAGEFYKRTLSLKDLHEELYNQARYQLNHIINE